MSNDLIAALERAAKLLEWQVKFNSADRERNTADAALIRAHIGALRAEKAYNEKMTAAIDASLSCMAASPFGVAIARITEDGTEAVNPAEFYAPDSR
jgi:hypothetical protein